jgi:hypothetical protein
MWQQLGLGLHDGASIPLAQQDANYHAGKGELPTPPVQSSRTFCNYSTTPHQHKPHVAGWWKLCNLKDVSGAVHECGTTIVHDCRALIHIIQEVLEGSFVWSPCMQQQPHACEG